MPACDFEKMIQHFRASLTSHFPAAESQYFVTDAFGTGTEIAGTLTL